MGYMSKLKKEIIEVRYSNIHGNGLFAINDIPANNFICTINGEQIDHAEAIRREKEENNVYIFWNDSFYIDASLNTKIRYVNHSCCPNCEVEDYGNTLALISKRNIQPDEEITIDYGYTEIYEMCSCAICCNQQ